jgi:PTH1 family peptidyl-tRNA hydrolase
MISLVVFLGNPGAQYQDNRHNVAWQFAASQSWLTELQWVSKFRGHFAKTTVAPSSSSAQIERPVYLIIPQTFMNLSGEAAGAAAHFFRVPPEEVLVVHDELELPFGVISVKWSGGLGGHNGLRSMEANFGTRDFWRLRFGIGRPDHPDVAGYVLSDFSASERLVLPGLFEQAGVVFNATLTTGPEVQKIALT